MGGQFDSSLTRVQPVFRQLMARDATGESWVLPLLALASRWDPFIAERPGWTPGLLREKGPCFEHPAASPLEYLSAAVTLGNRLSWPLHRGERRVFSDLTNSKRTALLAGDLAVTNEALEALKGCRQGKYWWILEGITRVDAYLPCDHLHLFVEGKRTERCVREPTEWDPKRIQLFRNLDCLRASSDDEDFAQLAIVERGSPAHNDAFLLDTDYQAARDSWPHLSDAESEKLWGHYLGYITWQDIAEMPPGLVLPNTVAESRQLGLCD